MSSERPEQKKRLKPAPVPAADTRSLLSTRSLAPSVTTASPRPTSALTASPSTFTIGRSPSGNVYDPKGGAAARLKRVASNASIAASSVAGKGASATQQQQQQRQQDTHSSPQTGIKRPDPPEQESIQEQYPRDFKRSTPPATRPASRRKTWFGWSAEQQGGDGGGVQSGDMSGGTEVAADEAMTSSESKGEEAKMAGATPAATTNTQAPPRTTTPLADTPATTATPTPTLRPPATPADAAQARRTSWFAWAPVVPMRGGPSSETIATGGTTAGEPSTTTTTDAAAESAAAAATTNPQTPAQDMQAPIPTTAVGAPATSSTPTATATAPPSWLWTLWNRSRTASDPGRMDETSTNVDDGDDGNGEATTDVQMSEADGEHAQTSRGWTAWIPYWSASAAAAPQPQPQPLTPAQQVKADALARPDVRTTTPSHALSTTDAVLNPATRSSWISYFSSKSARPAARVEADEPEVMRLDFGDTEREESDKAPAAVPATAAVESSRAIAASRPNGAPPASRPTPAAAKKQAPTPTPTPLSVPAPPPPHTSQPPSLQSGISRPASPAPRVLPDPAPASSRPTTPLTSSKAAKKSIPPAAPAPNLVLPTFEDTFFSAPRSIPPPAGMLKRTLSAVNTWLGGGPSASSSSTHLRTAPRLHGRNPLQAAAGPISSSALSTSPTDQRTSSTPDVGMALAEEAALRLPRAWETMGQRTRAEKRGCEGIRRVCIVALHGWFAQSWASRFMGEPTGTSVKFAVEMRDAVVRHFRSVDGMELNAEAITMMPLSADGTVQDRTDKSFAALLSRQEWVHDLAQADAVFFACHSQGCIVGTNLLARLIEQRYISSRKSRIALLGMCGIHAGPFEHLRSSIVSSYVNYFETAAAKELFEFQRPDSQVAKSYEASLRLILDAGTKIIWVASTDDQVVPLHSALHSSASHPSILRALYIHGATFPRLDFLTNMLTFCVGVRNAGLSDHDLLALLSASVAGSLYGGLGHSLCYEEGKTYDLAVSYLLRTSHPLSTPTTRNEELHPPTLHITPMDTRRLNNPHLLPWSLRGLLEDRAVRAVFGIEIGKLLDDFGSWKPLTKTLRDVQYRLEPMRSVPRPASDGLCQGKDGKGKDGKNSASTSKL